MVITKRGTAESCGTYLQDSLGTIREAANSSGLSKLRKRKKAHGYQPWKTPSIIHSYTPNASTFAVTFTVGAATFGAPAVAGCNWACNRYAESNG